LRRTLGENGSMLVRERFSAAGMAHKYLRLYESAVR